MLGKKELVVCSVFGYIILTLLILLLRDKRRSTDFCTADNNCARFCCEDIDTCNERFIHENFNASLRHSDESREEGDDESGGESKVKILYGKPTCSLRLTTKHGYWHLNSVRWGRWSFSLTLTRDISPAWLHLRRRRWLLWIRWILLPGPKSWRWSRLGLVRVRFSRRPRSDFLLHQWVDSTT